MKRIVVVLVSLSGIFQGCGAFGLSGNTATNPPVSNTAPTPAATNAPPTTATTSSTPTPTPSPNETTPPPAPKPCPYALCEDFENEAVGGSPNAKLWAVSLDDNTDVLAIGTAQVQQGNQALHIYVPNNNNKHAMIMNQTAFPFANDQFWGRAYVWFGSALPGNHTTYVAAGPNPNPYEWIRYSTFGGDVGGNDSGPDNSATTTTGMPIKAWACLEWQYDGPNQTAHYYLNGTEQTTLNIEKTGNSNDIQFKEIEFGFELYQLDGGGATGWDMYLDNIALDANRINCTAAP